MFTPAIILHGEPGTGLWERLSTASRALLCERRAESATVDDALAGRIAACGECPACRLLAAGTHPDLLQLVPEALALELGLPGAEAGEEGGSERRAPGKEISIDAVRRLVDWAHATSHRGGVKVAVLHPLDAMAAPAANALLKTLEEPPSNLLFLLGTHRLDQVLPTLRSRARLQATPRPDATQALQWLRQREVAQPDEVAAWCRNAVYGAEPDRGLAWAQQLLDDLVGAPGGARGGNATAAAPAAVVAALQKLSVDLLRVRHGLDPLYLPARKPLLQQLAERGGAGRWLQFWQRLAVASRTANFPLHAGLATDAWVLEFRQLFGSSAH